MTETRETIQWVVEDSIAFPAIFTDRGLCQAVHSSSCKYLNEGPQQKGRKPHHTGTIQYFKRKYHNAVLSREQRRTGRRRRFGSHESLDHLSLGPFDGITACGFGIALLLAAFAAGLLRTVEADVFDAKPMPVKRGFRLFDTAYCLC